MSDLTARDISITVLRHLKFLLGLPTQGLVNEPRGVCYIGANFVALVVPNGIQKLLDGIQQLSKSEMLSQKAVVHALHDSKGCHIFSDRKSVCRARISYGPEGRRETVNVVLIPRELIKVDQDARAFKGAIEFHDLESNRVLAIPGFRSRHELGKSNGKGT